MQCNVGNRSPVLLFSLLPNKRESCRVDFEFEEADDVIFSVIGPQSVHLTGYYVQQNKQSNPHSDTYPFYMFSIFILLVFQCDAALFVIL